MFSALVVGATGILGRALIKELGREPSRWTQIYALSRTKKEEYPPNAVLTKADLTAPAEEIAKSLKDVKAEYVFFAAYLQQGSENEQTKVNGDMFDNFLNALQLSGLVVQLKRIVLVTGAKQYGLHLGRPKLPMVESDPWLPEPPFPPNFYYRQQRSLHVFCEKHKIEWVVTYPNDVIGFAKGNFMNLASAIGIYASIHKELGHELPFPGSQEFYSRMTNFTDSNLHARFCVWAALEPEAANQSFNVANGDTETWQNIWPRVASYFGLKVPADQFSRPSPESSTMLLADQPPISLVADSLGLQGQTPQSLVEQRIDLDQWSKKKEVAEAWQRLVKQHSLDRDAFEAATWGFLGFVLGRNYDIILSMSKARELGWTGYLDTWSSFEQAFRELKEGAIIPRRV